MRYLAASTGVHGVELGVVTALFVLVAVLGFLAARWRRTGSPQHLHEWGLGGRSFGGFITWFLIGGDLYTAYTFVAVPAALFAGGALGFFAVGYTILVWPLVFIFLPRLWSVSRKHGYVTPADFVKGRHGSRSLSLAIAVTGIVATMPYIALQLVGIQSVLYVMGIGSNSSSFAQDLPLFVAFIILAAFTYTSGLRAPAMIAFVKDLLIYVTILVAVIYIPTRLGGWTHIFGAASTRLAAKNPVTHLPAGSTLLAHGGTLPFATLAIGSAMALFMYPHAQIGVLATKQRSTVRRNVSALTVYSLMLGFVALLGYMAIAAGFTGKSLGGNAQHAVPALFDAMFPSWFAGIALAAIVIGALVPAAIMSIAAANLFTRNIYVDFVNPAATDSQQTNVSKWVSLLVKFGALAFVLGLDATSAINFQLLGGVLILQTFPAIVGGLYTRYFHRWALLLGWAAGIVYGTVVAWQQSSATQHHFASQVALIPWTHQKAYIAVTALVVNLVVLVVSNLVLRAIKAPAGVDATSPADYDHDSDLEQTASVTTEPETV
ncbi:sodium:solute symporter family protein [Actinospica sp. MGRD01-02]|uniref:Sodium:solute symporter family protein n=1 Tax=Actinospica acidithermotolerans TaxID=2828514 RepID=A0A941II03_9ACTN|nr:sodium:solute symporter family protein [Actinospica acidithermotolerans]MBR7829095.1 sodium:solute symporter family protein [Actinospica acidithermotolerans]